MFHTPPHKLAPEFPQAGQLTHDPYADDPRVIELLDIEVSDHGSIVLLTPQTADGIAWCEEYIGHAQRWGFAYAVERRYVCDIIDGMYDDGLKVA